MWEFNQTDNLPGESLYHSADELYHYGVVGMKWKNHIYKTRYDKYMSKAKNAKASANEWKQIRDYKGKMINLGNKRYNKYIKQDLADSKKYEAKANKYLKKMNAIKSYKQAKAAYKNSGKKAFDKYLKSIESIEKGYKRGQMLSEKDLKREERVEREYEASINKAKKDYQKAKMAYKKGR